MENRSSQWNAALYDGKHAFVSKYGSKLIDLLNPKNGEFILDLGCGTGDLANELHQLEVKVKGIDQSATMINQAKNKFPYIDFHVQDAKELSYSETFDAVFSNATLHWIKSPKKVLDGIYKSLKDNGRFVAEFGGKGNIEKVSSEVSTQMRKLGIRCSDDMFPWYFPSIGTYTSLMESSGFKVTFAQHFERPTQLDGENGMKNWIVMFGNLFFKDLDEETKSTVISNTVEALRPSMFDGQNWIADYKRIRVVGIK